MQHQRLRSAYADCNHGLRSVCMQGSKNSMPRQPSCCVTYDRHKFYIIFERSYVFTVPFLYAICTPKFKTCYCSHVQDRSVSLSESGFPWKHKLFRHAPFRHSSDKNPPEGLDWRNSLIAVACQEHSSKFRSRISAYNICLAVLKFAFLCSLRLILSCLVHKQCVLSSTQCSVMTLLHTALQQR